MKRLAQPTAWRLMLFAFALWAVNFLIGYAAVLIDPDALVTRVLLVGVAIASVPVFVLIDRSSAGLTERKLVRAAVLVAGLATLFNGVTALA